MILSDTQIKNLAINHGMITPFTDHLVREVDGRKILSRGAGSYGYDITLSPTDFRIFRHIPGSVIDPKNFNPEHLEQAPLHIAEDGSQYFIIPGHSYGLGVTNELIQMPPTVTAICLGKSTYARVALIANITPIEAGWIGHITLEFSNSSPADVRIYANEGVAQLLFFEGQPCATSYADRQGKYQNQGKEVTLAKA